MSADEQTPKPDVLFVHSPVEKGDGFRVIRANTEGVQVGEIRSVKEGEPIKGDLVKLKPRKEHKRLFDVETMMAQSETQPALPLGRPAQVATDDYRRNWDAIFGARPRKDELPN